MQEKEKNLKKSWCKTSAPAVFLGTHLWFTVYKIIIKMVIITEIIEKR